MQKSFQIAPSFWTLSFISILSLNLGCADPLGDLKTYEQEVNENPKLSTIYALGKLRIDADGEITSETFSGTPNDEVLPIIGTANLEAGRVGPQKASLYSTKIESQKTGDFDLEMDFAPIASALKRWKINPNEVSKNHSGEKINIMARINFDPVTADKETWINAEVANVTIRSLQNQSKPLEVRGTFSKAVYNDVKVPLIDFDLELRFRNSSGRIIVISGRLGGYLSKWLGDL